MKKIFLIILAFGLCFGQANAGLRVIVGGGAPAAGGGGSGEFGNLDYSTSVSDVEGGTATRAYLGLFAISENGDVETVTALLEGSGTINVKALIYDDNGSSGNPGTLLGQSQNTSVTTTKQDYTFTFSTPVSLTTGSYWIGIIAESGSAQLFYENETGTVKITENLTYASPGDNPTIASTYTSEEVCLSASYSY